MDRDVIKPQGNHWFARWFRHRIWNRGIALVLIAVVLLIGVYYMFENWRSRAELASAHQRLIERLGTDDPLAYAPALVPDEQNFFCIPVIQSWAVPDEKLKPFFAYKVPDHLVPKDFIWPEIKADGDDGLERVDLKGWVAKRAAVGHPVPQSESPAAVMDRELGDGDGILPQLASGLDRPYSCYKPGCRELLRRNGGNPLMTTSPYVGGPINQFLKQLALHIHAAAHSGNAPKTRDTALIALRFGEGACSWGGLLPCLVGLGGNEIIFPALNDALACPVWDGASLTRLQTELAKIDDLQSAEHMFGAETIQGYQMMVWFRDRSEFGWAPQAPAEVEKGPFGLRCLAYLEDTMVRHGPSGWHDANIAFYLDQMLELMGPKADTAWVNESQRDVQVHTRTEQEYSSWYAWNPRHVIGANMVINIGRIYEDAAKCLFQRRCLIIGCALERHRMTHGVYPTSLAEVQRELAPFRVNDPARPDHPPGYRLEEKGYLLWSAGQDAKDDGGDPEKDWIWRMRRD